MEDNNLASDTRYDVVVLQVNAFRLGRDLLVHSKRFCCRAINRNICSIVLEMLLRPRKLPLRFTEFLAHVANMFCAFEKAIYLVSAKEVSMIVCFFVTETCDPLTAIILSDVDCLFSLYSI